MYAVAHSVVEAVSGMVNPEVSAKTPVVLLYSIPVMVSESDARAEEVPKVAFKVLPLHARFVPAVIRDDGVL